MSNDMVMTEERPRPAAYERMQAAIAECHAVDEVKFIADQAGAMAAYYKQIKDEESERKFLEVKLRAWRSLGNMLADKVTQDTHDTFAAEVREVRDRFADDPTVAGMNDSQISSALKVSYLHMTDDELAERLIGQVKSVSALIGHYQAEIDRRYWESDAGKAERKRIDERNAAFPRSTAATIDANAAVARLEEEQARQREAIALQAAAAQAEKEVGLTLTRTEREKLFSVVFLMKRDVHETLRKAAFDKRITMQAVLRQGLAMWFAAHGYDVALGDMVLNGEAVDDHPRPSAN